MTPTEIRWAGDHARLLVCESLDAVLAVNAYLTAQPLAGQTDLVPAATTLLVSFDTAGHAREAGETLVQIDAPPVTQNAGRDITIDVVYDGADLADVAEHTGLSIDAVIAAHTGQRWRAAFGGFAPGFFYMIGENTQLRVPRRASPRTRVPAGAVGLAGMFSAVYPKASPGGWQLIGRTDARLWDLARERPALLQPGDMIRYRAVEALTVDDPAADKIAAAENTPSRTPTALEIISPGPQSLVQDLGRPGHAHIGVSASGAADRAAARQANRLVGNSPEKALIETLQGGLAVRAHGDTVIALSGAPGQPSIDSPRGNRYPRPGQPFALHDSETLRLAPPAAGLRTYLAVRGGLAITPVLGSRARDTLAGLGPAPLAAGDRLAIAPPRPGQAVGQPEPATFTPADGPATLGIVLGPREDWFDAASRRRLLDTTWQISPDSDRVGLRLVPADDNAASTPPLTRAIDDELPSEGCVPGALQVPPAGAPILFLRDHPVTGGYPVIAVVVRADIDRAAQLAPGDRLCFIAIDPATDPAAEDDEAAP
ncbi:carboxyltransferase domain-containing protein [Salinisphaera japonica]|uniref:Urea amidolyase n=1 Tax=Salinisphaera japonica YTM-1 TaxID=1209778 RepID=A0A423PPL3_9GAMM|nr:carboxyltransferase domain-containing protein [Salinisphaera japonica]ROO27566.1 urea amidolyase [Salinisphaera japonica YTM-1]